MSTTACQGFRCEATATDSRVRADGSTFHCCDEHAVNFDAVTARNAAMAPFAAEARAEQALESRVS